MFHKSEILKNAVSERWCSDSSVKDSTLQIQCPKSNSKFLDRGPQSNESGEAPQSFDKETVTKLAIKDVRCQ